MLVELVKVSIFKTSLKFELKNISYGRKIVVILNYIIILTKDIKRKLLLICNFTTDKNG